jgi:hypothetical protein
MYPVADADFPELPTFLCQRCGFHPNTVLMEDARLYLAYARFYARFRRFLEPFITRDGTTLKITRRRDRIETSIANLK